jgi:hypothetical protein
MGPMARTEHMGRTALMERTGHMEPMALMERTGHMEPTVLMEPTGHMVLMERTARTAVVFRRFSPPH